MVLKFFNFGYFPARNKVRSKSLSQKKLVAYCVRRFAKFFKATRASRAPLQKRGSRSRGSHDSNYVPSI
jgi:hypothetical protein